MDLSYIRRQTRIHPGLLPLAGALLVWTLLWTVLGVQDVLSESIIGRGAAGATIDPHEVMQLVFVAAYTGVRWAAGVAILLAGAGVVWLGARRSAEADGRS